MEPRRIQEAGRHVRGCAACAAAVDRSLHLARSAEELWQNAITEPAEVDRPRRRWWTGTAIAASLAAIAVTGVLFTRDPRTEPVPPAPPPVNRPPAPPVATPSYGRPDWDALAAQAIKWGTIEVATVAALRPPGEHVRGTASTPGAADVLEPVGTVVASQRPTFRWSGPNDATYTVVVADADGNVVAKGEDVRGKSWTPERPLSRGAIYAWQLTVRDSSGSTTIVPVAPAPPALFAVLDAEGANAADEARAKGAHLIAAVLYAQKGARADAQRELDVFIAENPRSPLVKLRPQRGEPTSTNGDQ